jgi:hypothetical protein
MRSVAARCECANEDNDPLPIDPLPLPPFDLQLNAEGHQPEGWTMADWKRHKQMCYGTMETKFRDSIPVTTVLKETRNASSRITGSTAW